MPVWREHYGCSGSINSLIPFFVIINLWRRFLLRHIILDPFYNPHCKNDHRDDLKPPEPHQENEDPFHGERTCSGNEPGGNAAIAQSRNQFKDNLFERV